MNIKAMLVSMAMVVTAAAATGCSSPDLGTTGSSSAAASTEESMAQSATDWFAFRLGFAPRVVARPAVVVRRNVWVPGAYRVVSGRSVWFPGRYVIR
ncbi:MAG TPA: hypothetical protein VGM56_23820 [Byssovorax sp.]|jgi:hypothetical protein